MGGEKTLGEVRVFDRDYTSWRLLDTPLSPGRERFAAVWIPDKLAGCTCEVDECVIGKYMIRFLGIIHFWKVRGLLRP